MPIMSGRIPPTRLAAAAMTFTRPAPAAAPPSRPEPASSVREPRLPVLEATKLAAVMVEPAEPEVSVNLLAPSSIVTVFRVSTTAEAPPRKSSTPPRMLTARSAVVAMTLVVPPRRLPRALLLLSRTNVAPSARIVVTKPTLADGPSSVIVPLLSWRVPRMFALLSRLRFQSPAPTLVTLRRPEV